MIKNKSNHVQNLKALKVKFKIWKFNNTVEDESWKINKKEIRKVKFQ